MKLPLLLTLGIIVIGVVIGVWTAQPPATPVAPSVQTRMANAFGDLSLAAPTPATTASREATDAAGGKVVVQPEAPVYVQYKYVGEAVQVPSNWPVLRRVPTLADSAFAGQVDTGGLVNLTSFAKLSPQYVTLTEGVPGFAVNIDYDQGAITLYRQSVINEKLVAADSRVTIGSPLPLAEGTLDEPAIIAAAQAFLADHGISTEGLGAPTVRKDWLTATGEVLPFAAPMNDVSVVFPWLASGQPVQDESGNAYGLQVTVSADTKQVQSVMNLTTRTFESSSYELESSVDRIVEVAQKGGVYGTDLPAEAKAVTVSLGTPTLSYTVSRYQLSSSAHEFLVPALVFPVQSIPKGLLTYVPRAVVVPLVKQLLDQPGGAARSGTASGSSGATEPAPAVDRPAAVDQGE